MRSSPSADRLIRLDDPAAADAGLAGGKAAALARARHAGLPVLPGYVVPAAEGEAALAAGCAALRSRGRQGARAAVFALPVGEGLTGDLARAVHRLGGRVIVRSSSAIEHDPLWSGAFSSIREIGPGDVAAAVRSCWASAFAPGTLDRLGQAGLGPADAGLSLLVQPDLEPEFGGLARCEGDGTEITWTAGHPGAMLAGVAAGETVRAGEPNATAGRIGRAILRRVAGLARAVRDLSGDEVIEWAWAGDRLQLLQCGPGPRSAGPGAPARTVPGAAAGTVPGAEPEDGVIRVTGTACVAGDATGSLRYVSPGRSAPAGHILVSERPLASFAPLLFGARGIVCRSGPADCHLAGVAGALGVPMLVQARLPGPLGALNEGWLGRLSGHRGELALVPPGRCSIRSALDLSLTLRSPWPR